MTGPYRVEYLADSIVIRGPYKKTAATVMSTPHIVCDHMNAAHRAAIEQATGVVEEERILAVVHGDDDGTCDRILATLRTLLTDKEPDNDK